MKFFIRDVSTTSQPEFRLILGEDCEEDNFYQDLGDITRYYQNKLLLGKQSIDSVLSIINKTLGIVPKEFITVTPEVQKDKVDCIEDLLLKYKCRVNLKGFKFMISAITLYSTKMYNTGEMYRKIAVDFDDSPSRVERAIRHMITTSELQKASGYHTNSEIIAWLELQLRRNQIEN